MHCEYNHTQVSLTSHQGRQQYMRPRRSAHPEQSSKHKNTTIVFSYTAQTIHFSSLESYLLHAANSRKTNCTNSENLLLSKHIKHRSRFCFQTKAETDGMSMNVIYGPGTVVAHNVLSGSRRMLLHIQQQAAGRRHVRHL